MIWVAGIVWLIVWAGVWYGIAYARFGNASIVTELRQQHKQLLDEYDALNHELSEYQEQNRIIKHKAQQLLRQNEDYAKIVSQLSRYHYHLQQAAEKVKELNEIVWIHDDDLDKKLMSIETKSSLSDVSEKDFDDDAIEEEKKRFF